MATSHSRAIDFHAERLRRSRRRRLSADSGHQHFQVWPHHAIEAKRLRDSIELVQVEASAPPRFDESFHRNVQADLVPESKAVDHRSGDAVNPHHAAFDAMLFDSEIEECWGNPCHADRRVRKRWDACPARNGEPHLARQLRPEVVKEKRRREADDARRDDAAGKDEGMTFRHVRRSQAVSSWADLLQRAGPGHAGQRASVDALSGDIPGSEDGPRSGKAEQAGRAGRRLWCFAFSHD